MEKQSVKSQPGEDKRWRKSKRDKVRREKMKVRVKVGKSRCTVFFQWFVALEGRKVTSLTRRVGSQLARWEMNAVVARSSFPSHNVQSTPASDHFWCSDYNNFNNYSNYNNDNNYSTQQLQQQPQLHHNYTYYNYNYNYATTTRHYSHHYNYNYNYITTTLQHPTTLHYATTTTTLHSTTLH